MRNWRQQLPLLMIAAAVFGGTAASAQELDTVYTVSADGSILSVICSGNSCQPVVLLDNNPRASWIVAGGGGLFEWHNTGSLWRYTGTPFGSSSCPGWVMMDVNVEHGRLPPGNKIAR